MPKNERATILVIDDDLDLCALIKRYLTRQGLDVEEAYKADSGLEKLENNNIDLVLCDLRLPDMDGIDLMRQIKVYNNSIPVIIMTGYSDIKVAVKAMKSGAFEYVTKPIHPEEILSYIKQALKARPADEEKKESTTKSKTTKKASSNSKFNSFEYVEGRSTKAKQIQQSIELIAPTDMSVIILGETGTGKEMVARNIHRLSKRATSPFLAVDCGALPGELAASELFGHVKGAFTGAVRDKPGQFELAKGGTLFLDEIGNLSYENQIKLLRVIQERQIRRVGGEKDIDIDVRILVATNEDLRKAVGKGDFRQDLFYRLNEFKIELPPLRERQTDLIDFANFFLDQSNSELEKSVDGFSKEALEKLQEYYWYGNLRELRNVIKRATLLTQGKHIESDALPEEIKQPVFIHEFSDNNEEPNEELADLKSVSERAERKAIVQVLQKTGFNKTRAAQILKIDRKTLYNKMNEYGIDPTRG